MPKEKAKQCACEDEIRAAAEKIAGLLTMVWFTIGKTNKILRATEIANQERHKELLAAIGSGSPVVRTMVFIKKRREKIS